MEGEAPAEPPAAVRRPEGDGIFLQRPGRFWSAASSRRFPSVRSTPSREQPPDRNPLRGRTKRRRVAALQNACGVKTADVPARYHICARRGAALRAAHLSLTHYKKSGLPLEMMTGRLYFPFVRRLLAGEGST